MYRAAALRRGGAVRRHQYPAMQLLSGLREREAIVPAGDAARRGAAHSADVRMLRLWPAALLAAVPADGGRLAGGVPSAGARRPI